SVHHRGGAAPGPLRLRPDTLRDRGRGPPARGLRALRRHPPPRGVPAEGAGRAPPRAPSLPDSADRGAGDRGLRRLRPRGRAQPAASPGRQAHAGARPPPQRLKPSGGAPQRMTNVVSRRAIAVAALSPVAAQVRTLLRSPLTLSFMNFRSEPRSTIRTSSGGATTPLMTAVMKRALMGSMPTKFSAPPTSTARAMIAEKVGRFRGLAARLPGRRRNSLRA